MKDKTLLEVHAEQVERDCAEIDRAVAEPLDIVERLRFQTRYAKGLVPVTMFEAADEIKKLRHEIAVMTHGIEVENEILRQILRDAYEVYAGSEGIPLPETAAEAYLYELLMTMKDEIRRGLK